jgi:hypothetical protein
MLWWFAYLRLLPSLFDCHELRYLKQQHEKVQDNSCGAEKNCFAPKYCASNAENHSGQAACQRHYAQSNHRIYQGAGIKLPDSNKNNAWNDAQQADDA